MIGAGLVSLGGLALGVPVVIKPGIVVLAVGFSAVVGIFFRIVSGIKGGEVRSH